MKQSVKLLLLAVLFCASCTKAQDEKATDPGNDEESFGFPDEVVGNGTSQADNNRAGRIVKGSVVSITDYPYVVTVIVTFSSGGVAYSGGVIITNTIVLAGAADLKFVPSGAVVTVRAGSNYQDKEGTVFQIQSYVVHSQFDYSTSANNIAVVTIQDTFAGVPNVQPIVMHTIELDLSSPNVTNCFLVGWGMTETDQLAVNLKKADMKLLTDAACLSKFSNLVPSVHCAQSVTGFGCHGDGGSPFVCDNRLYGLYIDSACNTKGNQATQRIVKVPAASVQSFVSSFLAVVKPPRKNYMTCSCTTC